ncbi:hypothetical protein AVEN_22416-1 [Araneus ventricosus]|uniref:Uncharacterized protein n=1 Tax=Araneus ventricosus TaxID=182803 RepID=A0A4Y2GI51_ARAVE|nr:hypothetical protein AVEN_22416-1 [Araneus ventricosus]
MRFTVPLLIDSSTANFTCGDLTILPYELIHSRNRDTVGHNVHLLRAWQVLDVYASRLITLTPPEYFAPYETLLFLENFPSRDPQQMAILFNFPSEICSRPALGEVGIPIPAALSDALLTTQVLGWLSSADCVGQYPEQAERFLELSSHANNDPVC